MASCEKLKQPILTALSRLCEAHEAEIATLRAEIARLTSSAAEAIVSAPRSAGWLVPASWHLTDAEAQVMRFLMANETALKGALMDALYPDRLAQPEGEIVNVMICRMRKKLVPHGVVIITIWGQGYRLATDSRRRLLGPEA